MPKYTRILNSEQFEQYSSDLEELCAERVKVRNIIGQARFKKLPLDLSLISKRDELSAAISRLRLLIRRYKKGHKSLKPPVNLAELNEERNRNYSLTEYHPVTMEQFSKFRTMYGRVVDDSGEVHLTLGTKYFLTLKDRFNTLTRKLIKERKLNPKNAYKMTWTGIKPY